MLGSGCKFLDAPISKSGLATRRSNLLYLQNSNQKSYYQTYYQFCLSTIILISEILVYLIFLILSMPPKNAERKQRSRSRSKSRSRSRTPSKPRKSVFFASANPRPNRVNKRPRRRSGRSRAVTTSVAASVHSFRKSNLTFLAPTTGATCTIAINEIFGELTLSTAFSATRYLLNPMNASLFPKAVALASIFEKFRYKRLIFTFRPSSSTSVAGSVIFYVDTDPGDVAPTSTLQALNASHSSETSAWKQMSLNCSGIHPANKWFYTSTDVFGTTSTAELREDQPGALYVITDKAAAATFSGYLEVEAIIDFADYHLPAAVGGIGTATVDQVSSSSLAAVVMQVRNGLLTSLPQATPSNWTPTSGYFATNLTWQNILLYGLAANNFLNTAALVSARAVFASSAEFEAEQKSLPTLSKLSLKDDYLKVEQKSNNTTPVLVSKAVPYRSPSHVVLRKGTAIHEYDDGTFAPAPSTPPPMTAGDAAITIMAVDKHTGVTTLVDTWLATSTSTLTIAKSVSITISLTDHGEDYAIFFGVSSADARTLTSFTGAISAPYAPA